MWESGSTTHVFSLPSNFASSRTPYEVQIPMPAFSSSWYILFFHVDSIFSIWVSIRFPHPKVEYKPINSISPNRSNFPLSNNQFYFPTSSKQLYFLHPRDLNKFCLILAWHLRVCHYLKIEIFSPDVLVQVVGFCPFTMHFILWMQWISEFISLNFISNKVTSSFKTEMDGQIPLCFLWCYQRTSYRISYVSHSHRIGESHRLNSYTFSILLFFYPMFQRGPKTRYIQALENSSRPSSSPKPTFPMKDIKDFQWHHEKHIKDTDLLCERWTNRPNIISLDSKGSGAILTNNLSVLNDKSPRAVRMSHHKRWEMKTSPISCVGNLTSQGISSRLVKPPSETPWRDKNSSRLQLPSPYWNQHDEESCQKEGQNWGH